MAAYVPTRSIAAFTSGTADTMGPIGEPKRQPRLSVEFNKVTIGLSRGQIRSVSNVVASLL